jgi:hypothetical protein
MITRWAVCVVVLISCLACGGALVACAASDVVVAQEKQDSAAGTDADARANTDAETSVPGCSTSQDCAPAAYCQKSNCDAPTGTCTLRPLTCGDEEQQECGCDGVGYWNDCLRRRDGIASFFPGFCKDHFAMCGGPHDPPCPVLDAVCGQVEFGGPGPCGMRGACWVLPDDCPLDGGARSFVTCPGPWTMPPTMCSDLCSALRSQQPQVRAPPGVCP